MIRAAGILAALSAALLLAACGAPEPEPEAPPPSPLLYELASADGAVEGWLFGTIHALPEGTEWQSPAIRRAVSEAQVLVVEAAGLDDPAAAALFEERAAATGQPALAERVSPALRPVLAEVAGQGGLDLDALRERDTWAAALILAQAVRHGDPAHGVDRALLEAFAGRPVIELEGLAAQFDLFDTLPEREQRDLLEALLRDHRRWRGDPGHLARAWLAGDIGQAIDPARSALLADPELRETLLTARNRTWARQIEAVLAREPRVMVAVGAGHVPGPDGLAELLARRGYALRPLG